MIKWVDKTSLVNYPGKVVSTLFLGGCNFRCGYCHNPELIEGNLQNLSEDEILEYLEKNKKWLDGITVTGGEPLLYYTLVEFLIKVKNKGFLVKIDTNGSNPELLEILIKNKLVDYVAMDIKTSLDKYDEVARVNVDIEKIKKSVELIKKLENYEFRITSVPIYHDENVFLEIANWLKGSKKFVIQQFNNRNDMLDDEFKNVRMFSMKELENFKNTVKGYFDEVELR